MRDFFPPYPEILTTIFQPLGDFLHLEHFTAHVHETLAFLILYQVIYARLSPALSTWLFPSAYPNLKPIEKMDWNLHIVSLTQSIINTWIASYVILNDNERWNMTWEERVWGYTDASNMVLGVANGYFWWHAITMIIWYKTFGMSMVAHGICVLAIMLPGLKPAMNFYAASGVMWEFSNIFMNIHRYTVWLKMDSSIVQLTNLAFLILSFIGSRLLFGSYTMLSLFRDLYLARTQSTENSVLRIPCTDGTKGCLLKGPFHLPTWIIAAHLVANLTLNSLNWYWFEKIVGLTRRRIARRAARKIESKKKM